MGRGVAGRPVARAPISRPPNSRAPISRAAAIRALDAAFIEGRGLPGPVLMEHAAAGCASALRARFDTARTVILCGPGNNGGDGYAMARHLAAGGDHVRCVPVLAARSGDALVHARVAGALGLVAGESDAAALLGEATVVVDAVFGTGQRAPLTLPPIPGLAAAAGRVPLVAIDVPTGVDGDTGERVGDFPAAAFTITIGRRKPFLFRDAAPYAFVDIGLHLVATDAPEAELVEGLVVPAVGARADKWSRGHVGVVAGSVEKAGAGALAALGALRAGAGLVTLYAPREAWGRLGALAPEVMVEDQRVVDGRFDAALFARCDALVVGPGLGRAADGAVRALWAEHPGPVVVDADGLRALRSEDGRGGGPRLCTPHTGEAAHLLGKAWADVEGDRLAAAAALRLRSPAILKGACSVVTGAPLQVLAGGVPALGTAGSGDVLAGACGAWLARGGRGGAAKTDAEVEERALVAAWLHQEAGRRAGGIGATASEIASALREAARAAADPAEPARG